MLRAATRLATTPSKGILVFPGEVSDKLQFISPKGTCHGGCRAAVPMPGSFA